MPRAPSGRRRMRSDKVISDKENVPADASVDPDELISDLSRLSIAKTSLVSILVHVVLVGLTSIGFIALCVRHDTLHPRAVLKALAEKQRQAKLEAAREAARKKLQAQVDQQDKKAKAASKGPEAGKTDKPKSKIEKTLQETSPQRPKASSLNLDNLDELERDR